MNEKGQKEKIRSIEIDIPEVRRTGRTEVEYFGNEAPDYVINILARNKVRLEFGV